MGTFVLILLLLAAVLLSAIIDQIVPKVSLPLVQIGLGIIIALFSVSPIEITLDPNLFLVLFIAPLLFNEAKNTNKTALWRNRKPILSLSVGLVLVAALGIGFYLNWLIPSIPLAAAFALGAALGPTDAVAVASLSKDTNISSRQKSILSGESLINDAASIVTFQFALAAVVTGAFSLLDASISFVFHFIGGILVGIILAYLLGFAIRKIRDFGLDNTTFHVLFDVCIPFLIYLVADALEVSGILAVVAAGLMNVMSPRTMGPAESRLNIVSSSVWQVVTFALNGIVFVLLGALLPGSMQAEWEIDTVSNFELVGYVCIITLGLTVIRFFWLFVMRLFEKRKLRKKATSENTKLFDKDDLRHCAIMTFSGARGAIALALVLTIPVMVSNGNAFPQRNLIIFIVAGVIILTLIMATFIVPLLAPKKKEDEEVKRVVEASVLVEILRNVIEELTVQQTPENREATQSVIRSYNKRIERVKENSDDFDAEPNKELRLQAIRWEQEYVLELMDADEVDPVIGYQYLNRLAHIQNLLKHHSDNRWMWRRSLRRMRHVGRSLFSAISAVLPGSTAAAEKAEKIHDLHVKSLEFAISKLVAEVSNPETATEEATALVLEYQRTLTTLKSTRFDKGRQISMSSLTQQSQEHTEVERRSLYLELEQIQNMYEAGRLSRAATKRLRENVSLMQIDLEDHI